MSLKIYNSEKNFFTNPIKKLIAKNAEVTK